MSYSNPKYFLPKTWDEVENNLDQQQKNGKQPAHASLSHRLRQAWPAQVRHRPQSARRCDARRPSHRSLAPSTTPRTTRSKDTATGKIRRAQRGGDEVIASFPYLKHAALLLTGASPDLHAIHSIPRSQATPLVPIEHSRTSRFSFHEALPNRTLITPGTHEPRAYLFTKHSRNR